MQEMTISPARVAPNVDPNAVTNEEDRNLVTIETITALNPITDADLIEAATIRGWIVVVKKGELAVGDPVAYFEIDSLLPLDDPRFAFLAPRGEKVIDGVRFHVLGTARLRGVYSQGLVIALSELPELAGLPAGTDVSDRLSITKWVEPIPEHLREQICAGFPTRHARVTGAMRVQNLTDDILTALPAKGRFAAAEKVDGASMTVFNDAGRLRVAGRNWEFRAPANQATANNQWKLANSLDLLSSIPQGWIVQGEQYGEGTPNNRNPLKIRGSRFAVFSVLRGLGDHVPRDQWPAELAALAVPVYDLPFPTTVAQALTQVDRLKSLIAPGRIAEGVVWHDLEGNTFPELNGRDGFKAVSNHYLTKNGG